jgi:phosphoribosyl-ATP pyrophosphohydrolase
MGYHIKNINKGSIGELSKIVEEVEELVDADEQKCRVMVIHELSDIVGAIQCYLLQHHPTLDINDLIKMAEVTSRVFKEGHRK